MRERKRASKRTCAIAASESVFYLEDSVLFINYNNAAFLEANPTRKLEKMTARDCEKNRRNIKCFVLFMLPSAA
jgi:hypothetical protein